MKNSIRFGTILLFLTCPFFIASSDYNASPGINNFIFEFETGVGILDNPRDVTIDAAGNFFVADGPPVGGGFGEIHKFNASGNLVLTINHPNSAPQSVILDGLGNIYVLDIGAKVTKYSPSGSFLTSFSIALTSPKKIIFNSAGELLVLNVSGAVYRYSVSGTLLSLFPTAAGGVPIGMALNSTGMIHVLDARYNRIYVYSPTGTEIKNFFIGAITPNGLAIDNRDDIYVVDRGSAPLSILDASILKFDPTGNRTASITGPPLVFPTGIDVDDSGKICITDEGIVSLGFPEKVLQYSIELTDNEPPVAICQDITVELDPSGHVSITAGEIDNGSNDASGIASLSVAPNNFTCADVGTNTVTLTVTDVNNNVSTCEAVVTVVDDTPPTPDEESLPTVSACEVTLTPPTATDACAGVITGTTTDPLAYDQKGVYVVTWSYEDEFGNRTEQHQIVVVEDKVAPEIQSIMVPPDPVPLGSTINVSATFADDCDKDDHYAEWEWGDFSTSTAAMDQNANTLSGSHDYLPPGVYVIKLTLWDGSENQDEMIHTTYAVVYDPSGGFVTGGGWVESPPGAYPADPMLTGKANFGFVSKYKKGTTIPFGNTEFQFNAADLNYKSSEYEWLVIAGPSAKFKGSGTINRSGNYGFMVTGIDGDINGGGETDKFRIKIWDKENYDMVVYDNKMESSEISDDAQELGGGSITIHQSNNDNSSSSSEQTSVLASESEIRLMAFPNPFRQNISVRFYIPEPQRISLQIFGMQGKLVRNLHAADVDSGVHELNWNGTTDENALLESGVYIIRLLTDDAVLAEKVTLFR